MNPRSRSDDLSLESSAKSESAVLARELRKEIASLKRSRKFYWRSEAGILSQKLSRLRFALVEDLAAKDPAAAIKGIQSLLDTQDKVFNQVDDSHGCMWPVYQQLVEDLGELYARNAKIDRRKLAREVFDWITNQQFNVYDYVVRAFTKALGDPGLTELEQLFREDLRKSQNATPEGGIDFRGMRTSHTLEEIADARGNVDEYIAVVTEFGTVDARRLDIAKRLLAAGRCQEALDHLAQHRSSHDAEKVAALKAEALIGLGRQSDAQECRIANFATYPSSEKLDEILEGAASPGSLRQELLARAETSSDPYRILAFLINTGELGRAAAFVLKQRDRWNGHVYQILQPAAKSLSGAHPLAATVLFRALIEDILGRAQSKYYHHAARYLKAASKISTAIKDWAGLKDHEAYVSALQEEHKRKQAFWAKLSPEGGAGRVTP